jgi:hypothetical protein
MYIDYDLHLRLLPLLTLDAALDYQCLHSWLYRTAYFVSWHWRNVRSFRGHRTVVGIPYISNINIDGTSGSKKVHQVDPVRRMNSREALFSDTWKAKVWGGQIWRISKMTCSAQGIVIQELSNHFGTMRSDIVSVNHKMSPLVILIRSKNSGQGDRMWEIQKGVQRIRPLRISLRTENCQ